MGNVCYRSFTDALPALYMRLKHRFEEEQKYPCFQPLQFLLRFSSKIQRPVTIQSTPCIGIVKYSDFESLLGSYDPFG